ncbi:MAG: hypothetical protein ACLP9L_14920 [Thermoguttaceae bacterium]
MRTPESKIKEAILHPFAHIREKALCYFAEANCADESIMPLVVQAVRKHKRKHNFRLLRAAERLPQTQATVDWCIKELRRDYDLSDVRQENHCFAVAFILYRAPQPLLWKRLNAIFAAPAFPVEFQELFSERLNRFSWTWDEGWAALKHFGEDTKRRKEMTANDLFRGAGIVEALARHRKKAKKVLALLDEQYGDEDFTLMNWLWPQFADLAAEMRLEEAVPLLMKHLGNEIYSALSELSRGAVQRIGGELVVREIDARWRAANNVAFRREAANVLYHVRSDLCAEHCLQYFKSEEDYETKLTLAAALLANFSEEAVDPVSKFLADVDDAKATDYEWEVRCSLVTACSIMERTFPKYLHWYQLAVLNDWGRFGEKPGRMADAFAPDQFGPKWTEN